jgi:hypothetical protein
MSDVAEETAAGKIAMIEYWLTIVLPILPI